MMTGWLNAISAVRMWIAQKRLPAGFFGIVMIMAELMDIGSDLLVSGLVKPIQIPGRCSFGQGIVLTATPVNYTSIPGFWGPGYQMVSQAQSSSQRNNGLLGLYQKINQDPNFRAKSQDAVGHWDCVDIQHDVILTGTLRRIRLPLIFRAKGTYTIIPQDNLPEDTLTGLGTGISLGAVPCPNLSIKHGI
jgi:hypothetical protein